VANVGEAHGRQYVRVIEVVIGVMVVVAVAAVTTSMSLRLLGVRRGWAAGLLSASIGWGTAAFVSLSLSEWNWDTEGLALHTFAIGIPLTMAVAVTLDLLARPGTLATGERAGLLSAPRPVRALKTQVSVFRRYRELLGLARQEGFGPLISSRHRAERTVDPPGVRLRRLLESAGGLYIKLGQIAATRVDLLPPEVCEELAELQNRVAPLPRDVMEAALAAELGRDPAEVFTEFDWEPLASASIGQTYVARLTSGEPVVVKLQRPGVDEVLVRDLAALSLLAGLAQRRTAFGQDIRSGDLLDQFAESLAAELDFRLEAEAMEEMTLVLGSASAVRIPKVHRGLTSRRLLVQERFEGFTLADSAELRASDIDRDALAHQLLGCTLDQIMGPGLFHADPHPGNVFVFADGTLGLIDFGAIGRLDPIQQAAIVDIVSGLVRRDIGLLREGVERVADVASVTSLEDMERALSRLVAQHVRATGTIDPTVLQDLVSTLTRVGVQLPTDLVVLSRALATVDGTLRVISPGTSLLNAALDLVSSRSTAAAVDPQTLIRDEALSALTRLRRLPDQIDRILTLTARGDLRIRSVVDEDSQRIVRTLVNRALLTAVGTALTLGSVLLLVSADAGPEVGTGPGLFEIFGYGGLLAGTVLLLRVVAAVARDGTT
jgi:ubiquinone biosynthesis protein